MSITETEKPDAILAFERKRRWILEIHHHQQSAFSIRPSVCLSVTSSLPPSLLLVSNKLHKYTSAGAGHLGSLSASLTVSAVMSFSLPAHSPASLTTGPGIPRHTGPRANHTTKRSVTRPGFMPRALEKGARWQLLYFQVFSPLADTGEDLHLIKLPLNHHSGN